MLAPIFQDLQKKHNKNLLNYVVFLFSILFNRQTLIFDKKYTSMEKKTSIKNVNLFIISNTKQDLKNEIIEKIITEFQTEYESWENQKQECIHGDYTLAVCENVELAEDTEYISIPIDFDGLDGGYLHVYGLREVLE